MIRELREQDWEAVAGLLAAFRVHLRALKGLSSEANRNEAREELAEFVRQGAPIFVAEVGGQVMAYMVLRQADELVWVEQLYVAKAARRRGLASALFDRAEALAHLKGEETVYNYIHPNNEEVIGFLRARGYTVVNLVEIRKAYAGEKLTQEIPVGNHFFDY